MTPAHARRVFTNALCFIPMYREPPFPLLMLEIMRGHFLTFGKPHGSRPRYMRLIILLLLLLLNTLHQFKCRCDVDLS